VGTIQELQQKLRNLQEILYFQPIPHGLTFGQLSPAFRAPKGTVETAAI
jgi:hypothetical protein